MSLFCNYVHYICQKTKYGSYVLHTELFCGEEKYVNRANFKGITSNLLILKARIHDVLLLKGRSCTYLDTDKMSCDCFR